MSQRFDPPPGVPVEIAPLVRRILAPNPSPMTFRGTNTYLLGTRDIAVIDPGPTHSAHMGAIRAAIGPSQRITHIIVTHSHKDHSPLARPLSNATGAPVLAFGGPEAGRSAVMRKLVQHGLAGGGEGVDLDFMPDVVLADGDHVRTSEWSLEVMHTPGHMGNHICLAWEDTCFVGDHVMGWASSLVSPPDGDLTDFLASCHRLNARRWRMFLPGHGDIIGAPQARLDRLLAHRKSREDAILAALQENSQTAHALTRRIYHDVPAALLPAAERNVMAHLVDLYGKSKVTSPHGLDLGAEFSLSSAPNM